MITQNIRLIISILIVYLGLSTPGTCEPFIVLSYTNDSQFTEGDGNNEFSLDSHHSANYIVKQGDSLNSILKEFYTGSGLDRRFIQLSIVIANPHAFAKNNPNFLFSGKKTEHLLYHFRDCSYREIIQLDVEMTLSIL